MDETRSHVPRREEDERYQGVDAHHCVPYDEEPAGDEREDEEGNPKRGESFHESHWKMEMVEQSASILTEPKSLVSLLRAMMTAARAMRAEVMVLQKTWCNANVILFPISTILSLSL